MVIGSYEVIDCFRVKDIINHRIRFEVPLSYYDESDERTISIVANLTQKFDRTVHTSEECTDRRSILPEEAKIISYIQGGPGFPCEVPLANSGYTKVLLDKGFQVLYLDQRGTGLSTPLEVDTMNMLVPRTEGTSEKEHVEKQLKFILNFRADSIVEDFEVVRRALLGENRKWSILGQSFGGFCCFTYLSKYSKSLKEVLITGGVPPVNLGPEDVYRATYERTRERNRHYYDKYPQDIHKVKTILKYLSDCEVELPNGGTLSVERFQLLGLIFGGNGGTDSLHQIVLKFHYDLNLWGKPTYQILSGIQNILGFDTNVLYALFQEAIYCDANNANVTISNWSADRLRHLPERKNFVYADIAGTEEPVYFTGEMVFKSMFDDFAELRPFKDLAYALHANVSWSSLYDVEELKTITWDKVPVVAATYYYDQYVDFDTTMQVKKNVFNNNGNLKQYITSEFFHNGVRANPEKVLGSLFDLLDSEVD